MIAKQVNLIEEIGKLQEIENTLENYINELRSEQVYLRNFMQEMSYTSWQQGNAKESFFNRTNNYFDEFTREIQFLENVLLDITETRRTLHFQYVSFSISTAR
jgi:hypothetical protein